jgi:hypothetical protein
VTDPNYTPIWLKGYYYGPLDEPQRFKETIEVLNGFCRRNDNVKLAVMEAVERQVRQGQSAH